MDNKKAEHSLKVRIVHPDGHRQKFALTFSERKVVRLDQKRLGIDVGAVIEFLPGTTLCRPATGFTMTVKGFNVERTPIEVGSRVKVGGFDIEFLELPEPLPHEEATRIISIRSEEIEAMERTVVERRPVDKDAQKNISKGPNITFMTDPAVAAAAQINTQPAPAPAPAPATSNPAFAQQAAPTPAQQPPSAKPFTPVEMAAPKTPTPPAAPPPAPSVPAAAPRDDATQILRRMSMSNVRPSGPNLASLEPSADSESAELHHEEPVDEYGDPKHGLAKLMHFKNSKLPLQIGLAALIVLLVSTVISRRPGQDASGDHAAAGAASQASTSDNGAITPPKEVAAPAQAQAPAQAGAAIVPAGQGSVPQAAANGGPGIVAPGGAPSQAQQTQPQPQPQQAQTQPAQAQQQPQGQLGEAPTEPIYAAGGQFDAMSAEVFFSAIDRGDTMKVREMIDNRTVDVNLTLRRGYSALHVAAARGDATMVKVLLGYKANANARDPAGSTPLMWAVYRRHTAVVKALASITDLTIEREGGLKALDLAKSASYSEFYKMLTPKPDKKTKTASGKGGKGDSRSTASEGKPKSLPPKKRK